jgi:anti-anti-sigma factor
MIDVAISVLQDDDQWRVVITGELDMSTSPVLRERLADASGGAVVFDCSGLTFVDSSGITELLMLAKRVDSVLLEKPPPTLRHAIEVLGLAEVLPMAD